MNRLIATLFFFCFLPFHIFAGGSPEISKEELKACVEFLAGDSLKGRKPGTEGGKKAAEYIRGKLREMDMQLPGEGGFQYFDVVTGVKPGQDMFFRAGSLSAEPMVDFTPLAFSGSGGHKGKAVFAGFGFSLDEDSLKWDSYQDINPEGKWAIILTDNPDMKKRGASSFDFYSSLRQKTILAKDKGAKGVIFVAGPMAKKMDALMELHYDEARASVDIPVIQVKREIANALIKSSGKTIAQIEEEIINSRKPTAFETKTVIEAKAHIIKEVKTTQNVVGLLAANDPAFEDEFIIIGAHYDHLGMGGPGSGSRKPDTVAVHNGADDNASGVAAMLEILEKMAHEKSNRRNVLAIAFGAEEMGILGSKYFTDNPLLDLDNAVFMLNIDMVGRIDKDEKTFGIMGTGTAKEYKSFLNKYVENTGYKFTSSDAGYGPSDHSPFYAKEIPVLSFFGVAHQEYHTPEDDAHKLNYAGLEFIAKYCYNVIKDVDSRDSRLAYQLAGPKQRSGGGGRYNFRVTLGIMPSHTDNVKGLKAQAVIPGKPAELAGMKNGDVITAIDGKPVNDIYEYMNRLQDLRPGQRVNVDVNRDGEIVVLIVEL